MDHEFGEYSERDVVRVVYSRFPQFDERNASGVER